MCQIAANYLHAFKFPLRCTFELLRINFDHCLHTCKRVQGKTYTDNTSLLSALICSMLTTELWYSLCKQRTARLWLCVNIIDKLRANCELQDCLWWLLNFNTHWDLKLKTKNNVLTSIWVWFYCIFHCLSTDLVSCV